MIQGMARLAGLLAPVVPGADGTLHTDWKAKVDAALALLAKETPFVMLHLEAPDDCSHALDLPGKMQAIRMVDAMAAALMRGMEEMGRPFRLVVLPDHVTTTEQGLHKPDPVPWCLYDSREPKGAPVCFRETAEGEVCEADGPLKRLLELL